MRAERASIAAARQAEDIPRPAGPDGADIPQDAMIGLAFSGGGIRSATFNLGVLQALAKTGWLQQMDYLSTVSGGGYIGSWLSALKRRLRPKETINQTLTDLQGRAPAIQFLREYSNYLTPKTGLFSLDTLSAVVTYGRNLVLNQFVLLCFLTALLLCPHMLVAFAGYAATYPGGDMMSLAVAVLAAIFSARQARDTVNDGLQAAKPAAASTSVALLLIFVYAVSILALSRLKQGNLAWHELSLTPFLLICSPAYALYWAILAHGFTQLNNRGYRRSVCWALLAGLIGGGGLWLMLQALDYLLPVRQEPFLAWHVIGFGFVLLPAAFIMTATAHIGLVKRSFSELQREWWSRLGALLLVSDLALLLVFAMVALALPLVEVADDWIRNAVLPAWLLSTLAAVWQGQSAATSGKEKGDWREWVAKIGPYVFIAGLLLLVSALLSWLLTYFKTTGAQWALSDNPCPDYRCDLAEWASLHFQASHDAGHGGLLYLLLLAASLAVGIFASSRIDINVFSLHNFYRNRLTRCYLGASNRLRSERVNRFTGFCAEDDMAMSELARANPVQRPYHLINTALNLVSGSDLAWQQRKAASFTFSPLYCGYKFPDTAPHPVDVFVRTADYLQDDPSALEAGPMLGSLVATSGAAVSPNQGYHSSPAVSFLLTVFNVRLGRWCPNPNRASAAQLREMSPPVSWRYLLDELFGRTNAESGFVYLSDGGHFENLGIYELARRECALIIACDAGQDENMTFEDLGNAIRKCRIDLGAEIRIDVDSIRIDATTGYSPSCCQMGDIFYASGKRGRLLYLKPCLRGHGAEPVDVLQYKAANPSFPHQSTLNQWFDESQFESYRKLGLCIGETALAELSRPARAPDAADPA
ncbi:hypothetical protein AWB61_15335 [Chromobacterium sp. F49]|nr:hypothetical protein Cv017_05730 [Chromobacterium subtsugae]KZE86509.1 hypothetical protein AWB61_15335 [Chromobacterium sp. F49]